MPHGQVGGCHGWRKGTLGDVSHLFQLKISQEVTNTLGVVLQERLSCSAPLEQKIFSCAHERKEICHLRIH